MGSFTGGVRVQSVFLQLTTASALIFGISNFAFAQEPATEPKPDPAGVATGNKSSVIDAGGNSFAVSEPTDPKAADYAEKKQAYDEYQAQLAKEPLAGKLADAVGHVRIGTNFSW